MKPVEKEDAMNELERLKADLEVLERYHGYSILENAREDLANKIAQLEADASDPWRDVKEKIDLHRMTTDTPTVRLIAYIDHLTAREQELAHGLACMVSTYGKSGNDSEIAVNHARKLIDCEGEEIDVSFEIESAEAADPWQDARERIEAFRTSTDVATRRQVAYVDHLTAENARLTARVAELEAEAKAEDDEDLSDPDKCTLGDFAVLKTAQEIIRYAMDRNPDHFDDTRICRRAIAAIADFAEKVRHWHGLKKQLPYRWGSLGRDTLHLLDHSFDVAESPTDYDPDLIKPVADMQPPFEGPIDSIEPVLDPERVLATARWFLNNSDKDTHGIIAYLIACHCGDSCEAKPYKLKGGGENAEG